jgi:uncharacterized membrane protein YdjX (TVP38/TMEM64 family)
MAVDGDVARALGELVRERWRRARGKTPKRPNTPRDAWPVGLEPDLRDVAVAVARTEAAWDGRPEVREIEALYLDMIRAAQHLIYIENQYLTSTVIGDALCKRLRDEHGPEVVVVLPKECSGWLEELTMGVLRSRLIRTLREADRFGRLGIYYPVAHGDRGISVKVHSKTMVVDDDKIQIGSANLNNRSMGLDTECNLAIDLSGDSRGRAVIERFRNGLVGEHCGVRGNAVAEKLEQGRSLLGAIRHIDGAGKALLPLDTEAYPWIESTVPESSLLDPERPVSLNELREQLHINEITGPLLGTRARVLIGAVVIAALVAMWRWGPAAEWMDFSRLLEWAQQMRTVPGGWFATVLALAVASTLMAPITALIVVVGLVFGPWSGFVGAMCGSLLGATAGYEIGRRLGRDAIRRLGGRKLNRLNRLLDRRGLLAVAAVRNLPVAPFGFVNLVAGSLQVGYRSFLGGTLIGMAPGTLAIILLADQATQVAQGSHPETKWIVALFVGVVGLSVWQLRRWYMGHFSKDVRTGDETTG